MWRSHNGRCQIPTKRAMMIESLGWVASLAGPVDRAEKGIVMVRFATQAPGADIGGYRRLRRHSGRRRASPPSCDPEGAVGRGRHVDVVGGACRFAGTGRVGARGGQALVDGGKVTDVVLVDLALVDTLDPQRGLSIVDRARLARPCPGARRRHPSPRGGRRRTVQGNDGRRRRSGEGVAELRLPAGIRTELDWLRQVRSRTRDAAATRPASSRPFIACTRTPDG